MNPSQPPVPIFIVENNGIFEKMLDYIFSKDIVFKFHEFKSEEDCVKNLHIKPEVIVLDHSLSGIMNGSDTIREIKKQNYNTHIIILLDESDSKLAPKLLNAGANDYIFKGRECASELAKRLDKYLAKKNVKKPFYIKDVKPSLKILGYFFLVLLLLSLGVYFYK